MKNSFLSSFPCLDPYTILSAVPVFGIVLDEEDFGIFWNLHPKQWIYLRFIIIEHNISACIVIHGAFV